MRTIYSVAVRVGADRNERYQAAEAGVYKSYISNSRRVNSQSIDVLCCLLFIVGNFYATIVLTISAVWLHRWTIG